MCQALLEILLCMTSRVFRVLFIVDLFICLFISVNHQRVNETHLKTKSQDTFIQLAYTHTLPIQALKHEQTDVK